MKNLVLNLRNAKAQAGCANRKTNESSMRYAVLSRIFSTLLLLTLGVGQMWADGGIGYKGVKFTKNGVVTGWYNIHNVSWSYYNSTYDCRSGQSGVTDFNNANLGTVTTLKLKAFVVIGWTNSGDYVAGQLKYRLYKQDASAPTYSTYNVGNYGSSSNSSSAANVLVSSGNDRVVGNASLTTDIVTSSTAAGNYYLQLQGLGRMQWANGSSHGDFNANNGSEVKATLLVPGFTTTSTSNAYGSVNVGSNSSATISFTQHYGTALTTSNCALSGTNSSEFEVTGISETGVTVKFKPSSAGSKSATLTITDANSKTCTITLTGTGVAAATRTLTYHANYITTSGNGSGSVPAAQTVDANTSTTVANKNTLAFVNYTFSGWNTEEHINGTSYSVGSSITMDTDKDLYAVWTRTIPLDDQGATTAVTGDVYGTYNSSSLPSFTNPAKTGYTFQGWYTQIGGGGNFVINTSRVFQASKTNWTNASCQFIRPSTSTSSLYAKWTQSVTLNANTANHGSGSNRTATATWNKGTVSISTHCTPAAGYKLEGYYTAATGGTKILNADGSFAATNITNYITSGLWTKAGATTLYAHYEPLPKVYLKNTMNWANAYVTFYKGEYWDNSNGAGSYETSPNYAAGPVAMTYNSATGLFEYQCPSEYTYTYACFTKDQQNNYGNFYETEAIYCNNNLQYDKVAIVAAQTSSTHNSTKYYTDKTNGNIEFVALASGEGTGWFFPGGWSSWETKGNEATWNSTNVHFEKTLAANTSYEFKVYNHGVYYGNSGTYSATGSKTFTSGGSNCTLSTTLAGTYLFDYNVSTNSLTITFPEVYAVSGSFNSWTETTNLAFTGNDGTYSVSIDGSSTNYEFKVLDNAVWYGHSDKTFTATESNVTLSTGSSNIKLKADVYPSGTYTFAYNKSTHKVGVTYPTNYVVNFGKRTGGNTVTAKINNTTSFTSGTKIASGTSVTFAQTAKTGYTFEGWYNASSGGTRVSTSASYTTTISATTNAYANYTPNNYIVTLDVDEEHKGTIAGATTSQSVTYNAATVTVPNLPTAAANYGLYGYYTDHNGAGTKLINGDGTWIASVAGYTDANKKWIHDGDITLYAYYKQAEITAITLDADMKEPMPSADPDDETKNYVIANPTVTPIPEGTTIICWEFLYDNGNPLPAGHEPTAYTEGGTKPNQVRFPIVGLSAGTYKIRATLRSGSSCDGGTELSTLEKQLVISNAYTVTILYQDDDHNTLAASTTSPGKATEWTSISAPDIFGYTFMSWSLGDGITKHEDDDFDKQNNFRFKAIFDGTITAVYEKKVIFYFKNTLGWSDVYVNFMSNQYWDGLKGSGNQNNYHSRNNAMSLVPGTTDIYYIEYTGSTSEYITFTSKSQDGAVNFWGKNPNVQVVVPTRPNDDGSPQTDFGYHAGTNMFVPLNTKVQTKNTGDGGGADYYNRGYWIVYDPITGYTGYTLEVYNRTNDDGGRYIVKEIPFTINSDGQLQAVVDLEAATNYAIKFRRDEGMRYTKNGGTLTNDAEQKFEYHPNNWAACAIKTTAAGDYIFTINCSSSDGYLYLKAHFPAAVNDYRIIYTDGAEWSQGTTHTAKSWIHPSRTIAKEANATDTISFFIAKGSSPEMKIQRASAINASTGVITWTDVSADWVSLNDVAEAGVYNLILTQDGSGNISVSKIEPYTGHYYIRCGALNSKWDFYRSDRDHLMTYSSFSESAANSFGEKYSHYKAKWCPRGVNVKFVIANDYSPCISDTLIQDVGNPYDNIYLNDGWGRPDGELKADGYDGEGNITTTETGDRYSANIRFMWNRATNKISRAYIASSTNPARLFLVLRANATIQNESGTALNEQSVTNGCIMYDDENWIYERIIKVTPSTRFKLFACYAEVTATQAGAQYFRGSYNGNVFSGESGIDSENSVVLIGGSGSMQKARIIYDFKTNRLIGAWMPDDEVDGSLGINADVMIMREHQNPAEYIIFHDDESKLTGVKTVYGAMKFNRWILNNRAHPEDIDKDHCRPNNLGNDLTNHHPVLPVGEQKSIYERSLYFISFPFDVRVSEIFGFGRYWDEWYLEYYDGLNRAKNGYWMDSPPNWKYITPEMATDYVLKANEGYILGLDLDYMQADNIDFWSNGISTVELYFPSTAKQETLEQTTVSIPALGDEYKCTINRGTTEGDRRVKDSYWRCLGVPSFNMFNTALKDGGGNVINWKTDYGWDVNPNTFPFIYMWNKVDNTLTPQLTSSFTFQPMHAYLAQIKSAIVWENVSAKPSSIVARRENAVNATEYSWCLKLLKDSAFVDQTYVRMSNIEQVTDTFDFGQDLNKEFNKTRSNIYSYIGYEQVAANSMPLKTEQTTIVAVGLNILSAGDYTLAMPDGTNGVGITLVDSETGTRTNLSAGMTYTLSLAKGNYNSRFYLEISPVQQTPTGLEESRDESQESRARKVFIDGLLYIVRDGKLFDARGALVK